MKYTAVLKVLGEEWKSKGKTMEEALSSFGLEWQQIKAKGVLVVSNGTQKHEHLMPTKLIRRIFANKIVLTHWAKNLEYLLINDNKSNIPTHGEVGGSGENPPPNRRGRKAKSATDGGRVDTKVTRG